MDNNQNIPPLSAKKPDTAKTHGSNSFGHIQPPKFSLFFILICVFVIGAGLLFVIDVEAVVNGHGSVKTGSGVQPIETQEGGIIESVSVKQGDKVEEGQSLATLSNSTVMAERVEIENELMLLKAKEFRLNIERANGDTLIWPENLSDMPQALKDDQYDLFMAKKLRKDSELQIIDFEVQTLNKQLTGAKAELSAMEEERRTVKEILDFQLEGQAQGWVSKADALRSQNQYAQINRELVKIKTQIPSLTSQIQEAEKKRQTAQSKQAQEALDELEEVTLRIRTLEASIQAASDKDERRILRAPRAGIINAIHVTGPGDVVQPGEPVFDLVPVDQGLVVEARVDPSLRRGLYVGLPAKVTFTALQDLRVAPVDAKVVFVAADTRSDPDGKPYYEVHVQTKDASVEIPGGQKTVIEPGMQANVSIVVGSHTLADFLLRPLEWAARNAFRER
ncbi:MAG: hypothetical protein DI626_10370 [Micavibrio aeruginosavorus]|uniref:Uncharacterized protein n=1 Tax=Micavibrio aeruginosavorus TaxID=349221 RepID=A0A2W5BGE1_9BACT|nr:MAG: hypothetical protein DI626_10370 [Micavibrio aeruginosavorus]